MSGCHRRASRLYAGSFLLLAAWPVQDPPAAPPRVGIARLPDRLRIEIDGRLFTEYRHEGFSRPILFPVIGPTGAPMTRSWPMTEGEHDDKDHPHQKSLWFAHGDVNGHDFWTEGGKAGRILHQEFTRISSGDEGLIEARNRWVAGDGALVCTERRTLAIRRRAEGIQLDFEVELRASEGDLRLGDTKEGTMAIRLAPQLNLKGRVAAGSCVDSAGRRDLEVWGKRAAWVDYHGPIAGRTVGVALFDHPTNHAHPTWWHARDYGLFAANPFGAHDFEKKPKGTGDLTVPKGTNLVLRYRFLFHEGDAATARVAELYREYASPKSRGTR